MSIDIEQERPKFEAYIRSFGQPWELTRFKDSYRDTQMHNRWLGWLAAKRDSEKGE